MTKEITKAYIIQEIQDRFKLRDFEPEAFTFSERVTPIYDIKPHLLEQVAEYVEKSIISTGGVLFFLVPSTERWILARYDVVFMGAGAYTVAGVYTQRDPAGSTGNVYLDLEAAQTTSYHVNLPQPVILDPGDKVSINIDGYTSTQDLRLYIDYTKEVLR